MDPKPQVINLKKAASQYVVNKIRNQYPDLDMSEGSPFKELFVDTLTPILEPLIDRVNEIEHSSNISNAEHISQEELDRIGRGNYFISRGTGSRALGDVVFYLRSMSETNNLFIPQGTIVSTQDDLQYQVIRNYEYTPSEIITMYNPNSMMYEVIATVEAIESGDQYNIEEGEIRVINNPFSDRVVSVTNVTDISGGVDRESNIEFADTIKDFYTSRNLGTYPGDESFIKNNFPEVSEVYVAGKNDKFMERDAITYHDINDEEVTLNIGGKVDFYVRGSEVERETFEFDSKGAIVMLDRWIEESDISVEFLDSSEPASFDFGINMDNVSYITITEDIEEDTEFKVTYLDEEEETTVELIVTVGKTKFKPKSPYDMPLHILQDEVEVGGVELEETIDVHSENEFKGTSHESLEITINPKHLVNGEPASFTYLYNRTVKMIDELYNLGDYRVITRDIQVIPAKTRYINMKLRINKRDGSGITERDRASIIRSIDNYIDSRPMGAHISESKIVHHIHYDENVSPFLKNIKLPMDSFYKSDENTGDFLDDQRNDTLTNSEIEYFRLGKIFIEPDSE